ncbi:phage tail protein [Roseibium polysiphoniae]|uniref:Phage tail protein n=1 Tax=Roseibium polysiphoniae TaxID=2571221 RepID=A0A944GSK5_9HYPH|nr:tail protein X [Roseibium polysiphoniae]MBS8259716.1 phage tail protein [Roseibium polysiphoniae]
MPETITVRGDNLTLDLLLWRRYGVRGRELMEQALTLNPDLAAVGPILPLGTQITLPDLPEQTTAARQVVTLFG